MLAVSNETVQGTCHSDLQSLHPLEHNQMVARQSHGLNLDIIPVRNEHLHQSSATLALRASHCLSQSATPAIILHLQLVMSTISQIKGAAVRKTADEPDLPPCKLVCCACHT